MKKSLIALIAAAVTFAGLGFNASDAEAKRLGGGGSYGMQRSAPAPTQSAVPPKPATPAQATNPAAAGAPAAAQAGKRSWLGPIAGLAAGLGIAALLSHFGMGEGVANFLMIALLVFAAIFLVRFLMRRFQTQGQPQLAGAGAGSPGRVEPMHFEAANPGAGGTTPAKVGAGGTALESAAGSIPAGFDVEGFLRQAKLNFLRLQAANDRGDMDDVKSFTSPELFAEVQMQYEERGRAAQQTDVVQLDADLLEVVTEGTLHIASVRFHGQLSEESGAAPAPFNEVWHLVKPIDGSRGWMIAGIQQIA
ncbi:MAG: TIM44-like domain-containing protein [Rhodocyclaceae bacterium]|nr:TIM44-like domain-containing protein [Rhodocyclaceae bacterium]